MSEIPLTTKTIKINMADIGIELIGSGGKKLKDQDLAAMTHRWIITYLPVDLGINPEIVKSIKFPILDYTKTDEAIVELTYYDVPDPPDPSIETWNPGDAVFDFGQFTIKLTDEQNETIKNGEGNAAVHKFLVTYHNQNMPKAEIMYMIKSIELPTLDCSQSNIAVINTEFYAGTLPLRNHTS